MTIDPTGALPSVPDTSLPASVRTGTDADKQTYRAALAFERELLAQMMQALSGTTQSGSTGSDEDGSDDDGGSDAAVSTYQQMVPEQMANAVVNGGGTGLAENLYRALRQGETA